jgi:DUF917 family protein
MEIRNIEDASMLVTGATIMGTGGGGDNRQGLRLLREVLESNHKIRIVPLDRLTKEPLIAVPYFVGSVAPGEIKKKNPVKIKDPVKVAVSQLEEVLGKKITAFAATELGGLNTSVAVHIAARLGLPMVDGDLLGRAGPELHQCTAHLFDVSMCPSAIVTDGGNIVIVKGYGSIDSYEATARHQSVIAGHSAVVVDTPMALRDARKVILQGTVSLCFKLGKAVHRARQKSKDPVQAVVDALQGWKLFQGKVSNFKWKDESGFLQAELWLDGTREFRGHKLKSWIMNEHIMVWRDRKPVVMPPDLMSLLKSNGEAVTNGQLRVGMNLTAIAAKSPQVWRTARGLALFGPRHFGFDFDYQPVEKLLGTTA